MAGSGRRHRSHIEGKRLRMPWVRTMFHQLGFWREGCFRESRVDAVELGQMVE